MNWDEASDNLSRLLDKLYALNATSYVFVAEYASSVHIIEAEAHAIAFSTATLHTQVVLGEYHLDDFGIYNCGSARAPERSKVNDLRHSVHVVTRKNDLRIQRTHREIRKH